MNEKEVDWDEFRRRMDEHMKTQKKTGCWKQHPQYGFAKAVYEVEAEEGRPVYYGEVLHHLDKAACAGGRLDDSVRDNLARVKQNVTTAKLVGRVPAEAVAHAAHITKKQFLTYISNVTGKRKEEMEKWGIHRRVGNYFQTNEPFLYGISENVKGTVFEKMKGGKSEKNVALQFAKWLALKHGSEQPNYLTLI